MSARTNVFEHEPGDWWGECLDCAQWVTTKNASRRDAEQKLGRHLQNDPPHRTE